MAKRRVPSTDPATQLKTAHFGAARSGSATSEREAGAGLSASVQVGVATGGGRVGAGSHRGGPVDGGQSVVVRVRPGAGRTRVGGRYDGPHGPALVVAVGAPAVDGKATEAVRRALAEALAVRPRDVVLKLGATSRDKVFTVFGEVGARLAVLRDGST